MKTLIEKEEAMKTKVYVHLQPSERTNKEVLKTKGVITWAELMNLLSFNEVVSLVKCEIQGLTVHEATLRRL